VDVGITCQSSHARGGVVIRGAMSFISPTVMSVLLLMLVVVVVLPMRLGSVLAR
jgi:hypothetical protein